MTIIEFAIKHERWDLAAHVIVLAAARTLAEQIKAENITVKRKK